MNYEIVGQIVGIVVAIGFVVIVPILLLTLYEEDERKKNAVRHARQEAWKREEREKEEKAVRYAQELRKDGKAYCSSRDICKCLDNFYYNMNSLLNKECYFENKRLERNKKARERYQEKKLKSTIDSSPIDLTTELVTEPDLTFQRKGKEYQQSKKIVLERENCYVYTICWKKYRVIYCGIRVSSQNKPKDDLWVKYHTSSYPVYVMRVLFGEPDYIRVNEEFGKDEERARFYENTLINSLLEDNSFKCLNRKDIEWVRNNIPNLEKE